MTEYAGIYAASNVAAPAWTPASFPSITGWWEARDLVATADGASVATLPGKVASRNFAQSLTSPIPIKRTRNTFPCLEFTTGQLLKLSVPLSTMIGNTGLMAVLIELNNNPTLTSTTYWQDNYVLADQGSYFAFHAATITGPGAGVYAGTYNTANTPDEKQIFIPFTAGTRHALIMWRDPASTGSLNCSLDGVDQTPVTGVAVPQNQTLNYFLAFQDSGDGGTRQGSFWFYAAVMATAIGTAGERTQLADYLQSLIGTPPAPSPPVAAPDTFVVPESATTVLDVVANDTYAGLKSSLTVQVMSTGAHGTPTARGDKDIDFAAAAVSVDEADSFTYRITDANGTSNTTTVSLTVSAAAPGWTPASLPGLTGWWSMQRSPGLPAVGADLTSWQDLSGNSRHFVRRLTTAMPAHQTRNTYPAAEFVEASAESLQIATPLSTMIGSTGLMAVVVELNGQPTGTGADTDALYYRANGILFDANAALTDGAYWGMFCSFEASQVRWNMGIFDTAGRGLHGTITAGARHILMMRRDSTTLYASLDGGAEISVAASAPSNLANFLTLGANSGGVGAQWFNGWVYEAVAATSNGTAPDRASLISYLKAEWGIP